MTCTYEVVSVYVCPYCSYDNETIGPCARCGLAGNPSKTPWGIKDNRHTKYWNKYNWQAQPDYANHQERANAKNHQSIMRDVSPKKLQDARFLSAGVPALPDIRLPERNVAVAAIDPAKNKDLPAPSIEMPDTPLGEDPEVLTSDLSSLVLRDTPPEVYEHKTVLAGGIDSVPAYVYDLPPVKIELGERFDLTDDGWLRMRNIKNRFKPITDQSPWGTCYSHATAGIGGWYNFESNPNFVHWMYKKAKGPWPPPPLGDRKMGGTVESMLITDVNEGQINTNIEAFNREDADNCDDEKLLALRKQAKQVSVGSETNRSNVWTRGSYAQRIGEGVAGSTSEIWQIVSSSIYQGIPLYLSTGWPQSLRRPSGNYIIASGPTGGGNHAVSIVGVQVTEAIKAPGILDNPRLTMDPLKHKTKKRHKGGGSFMYQELNKALGLSIAEIKKFIQVDHKANEVKVNLGNKNFTNEEIDTILDIIARNYPSKNIELRIGKGKQKTIVAEPEDPDPQARDEPTTQQQGGKPDDPPKQQQLLTLNTKGKQEKPHYYLDAPVINDLNQCWVLIRNSYGEGWGDGGYLWVDFTSFVSYWNYIGSHIEITANNASGKGHNKKQAQNQPKQAKGKGNRKGKGGGKGGGRGKRRKGKAKNNPSPQMSNTTTPVQMRPRATHDYQPTGYAYTKPELLIALDIDDTLVDTSQRMRSAKRMGLFDPKQVGKKQHPKGREAFREYFYSSDRFSLDKPIRGTVDFAHAMLKEGYKIAYITGRPDTTLEVTKSQLRNLGFPLTNDKYGATLVYCKPATAKDTSSWKKNILSSLQSTYDVRFFFDNNPKNLEAGRQLGIPGLYLAIDQYTGITALADRFKKAPAQLDNPSHVDVSSYRRAAGCIVQRATDKKVLLLRRSPKETSMHGLYELPGGKLEEGETPKQTAKIETKEEAGMDVKIVKELTPVHVDHDMKKCYHCFLARPKKGAKVVLSEEHDHYMWVTPEEALTMSEPLSHHAEHFFRLMTGMKVNPHHLDEDEEAYRDMFDDSPYANPAGVIPIMTGEPTGKHTKLGSVFAEVFIGRNIGADVGEVVQAIYRGIIGGRTSMAEKRMAMAVATMQKELSDKALELGGNAVANLRVDYEMVQGAASVTLIAHGDAIKTSTVRNNPGGGTATKLYREFNGKAPDKVEKTNIKIPTTLVRVGEGGCWSVGYRSDKEGHGEKQKYIHEFGDFGRFPKKKPKKGHRKEPDLYAALDDKGNVIDLRIIGGTFSLDVDPDTGINWLVG